MKVALYARVSKEDGQTPENQIDIIKSLAERRGYEIAGTWIDNASGKDANRPQFAELMEAAKRHQFDAVLAVRLDRIMRSVIHLHDILQKLETYNVALIFSDLDINPKTPNGRLMMNFLSSIAEWERMMISARTREGLAHRKAKGVKLGRPKRDLPIMAIAKAKLDVGYGWSNLAKIFNLPRTTILDSKDEILEAMEKLKQDALTENTQIRHGVVSENVPTEKDLSEKEGVL